MNDKPLVSVAVPCLNRVQLLAPTLKSILSQDYEHVECVVVDGGSNDGTVDVLRSYNRKIRWLSEPDNGPPDAINKGWRMSSGEVLTWLNADDLWAPGAVRTVVSYMQRHPEVDVVYGDCGLIDGSGSLIDTIRVRDWDLKYAVEHCDHVIYQPASFIRRSILERVGWLWPKLCHDHELWLRISLECGRIERMPAVLAYARHHPDNLGYQPNLVIPRKLEITKKFFAAARLPSGLKEIEKRALSNTYLRGIDYFMLGRFRPSRDLCRCLRLVSKAFNADRTNVLGVVRSCLYILDGLLAVVCRRWLPREIYDRLRAAKRRFRKKLRFEHPSPKARAAECKARPF